MKTSHVTTELTTLSYVPYNAHCALRNTYLTAKTIKFDDQRLLLFLAVLLVQNGFDIYLILSLFYLPWKTSI